MKHEVEDVLRSGHSSRAEQWREAEPSGEDEPEVDLVPDGALAGGVPAGMDVSDVTGRAELAACLARAYPAYRDQLIAVARQNNAPDRILSMLGELPTGQRFDSVNDVWASLGHQVEDRRF